MKSDLFEIDHFAAIDASTKAVFRKWTKSSEEMKHYVVDIAKKAIQKYDDAHLNSICKDIKEQLDKKYGPLWHCIVGNPKYFGTFLMFTKNVYIDFMLGPYNIRIFQTHSSADM